MGIKVLVAGDFCPQERVAVALEMNDFSSILGNVKPIVEQSDYSIVNFECPVCREKERPIRKCGPNLKCTEKGIEAVKWTGFNCVTLANNHFLDYGREGVENTLKACEKYNISIVGGGINIKDASKTLYKVIDGKRLAVINCCEHEFSIATETMAGSNALNPIQQYYAIQEAKINSDFVLVIVHGGHEHFQLPSPRMQETYRFFVDAGADAVVNHHQHCYSGYEKYKGKPIFYGLGNFCFDEKGNTGSIWNEGYMVLISFDKTIEFKIIPYKQCDQNPVVSLLPFNAFDARIDEINKIICNKEQLVKKINEYYRSCDKQVSYVLEPFLNRVFTALRYRGILPSFVSKKKKLLAANFIGCESHRDILLSYLDVNY